MYRWFDKCVIFDHEVLLELYKLFLDIQGRVDCTRSIIAVTELGHSPGREYDETTFVSQYAVNRALHNIDLHLDDLYN